MTSPDHGSPRACSTAATVPHHRAAEPLARVAYSKLRDLERELQALLGEVAAAIEDARHESATAQGFLVHYGVDLEAAANPDGTAALSADGEDPTGMTVNPASIASDLQTLHERVADTSALYDKLRLAIPTIQDLRRQFSPETWAEPIEPLPARQIGQAVANAREDERRRLARELHDGPAQILANAIFSVEIAEQVASRAPDQVPDELDRLRDVLKLGMTEVRRLMFDLRPSTLDELGLVPTVRRYVAEYNRFFEKNVQLSIIGDLPRLTPDETLSVFRIIQEALQNVQKHARTDTATVSLTWSHPYLTVRVVDQGRGFRMDSTGGASYEGAGLQGMRERAELIGAEIVIASQPGAGTAVMLRLDLSSRGAGAGLNVES